MTSATGSADLSSWPQAGGETGLAAGDAICRTLAATAGLDRADAFVAWLSDSRDDAYCRAQGRTGRRAQGCAEGAAEAGPWVRTDGATFGAGIVDLLAGEVYVPVDRDESGVRVPPDLVFTGTGPDGEAGSATCGDWTSTDGATLVGDTRGTTTAWSFVSSGSCSRPKRLLCLDPTSGPPISPTTSPGRLAFVTAVSGPGDLAQWKESGGEQGPAAGDAICRGLAAAALLPAAESFKAWLSSTDVRASDRFENDGPWVRLDGVLVAGGIDELEQGALESSLHLTEEQRYLGPVSVWTGSGAPGADNCADWTSSAAADRGVTGLVNRASALWADERAPRDCSMSNRLYCLADRELAPEVCVEDEETLCLGVGGRFRGRIGFTPPDDATRPGRVVSIDRRDSGLFYFFDENNAELLLKVLDGCAVNNRFWVFFAATTSVEFSLTVEDTASGQIRQYSEDSGFFAAPVVADTDAFATCP